MEHTFDNKKAQPTAIYNSVGESQNNIKWKKPDKKSYTVWFHLRKVQNRAKPIKMERRENIGYLLGCGVRRGQERLWSAGGIQILDFYSGYLSMSVL